MMWVASSLVSTVDGESPQRHHWFIKVTTQVSFEGRRKIKGESTYISRKLSLGFMIRVGSSPLMNQASWDTSNARLWWTRKAIKELSKSYVFDLTVVEILDS